MDLDTIIKAGRGLDKIEEKIIRLVKQRPGVFKCSYEGCPDEIYSNGQTIKLYSSRRCRLLARRSKRGKRVVRRMDKLASL